MADEPFATAAVHPGNYDWSPGLRPCPFATMDWYCVLDEGHDGPHVSEDLS